MSQRPAVPLPTPKERRRLREAKSLTQAEVAARIGVSRETVRAWESGRTHPRGERRVAYARFLEGLAEGAPAVGRGGGRPEAQAKAAEVRPEAQAKAAEVRPEARAEAAHDRPEAHARSSVPTLAQVQAEAEARAEERARARELAEARVEAEAEAAARAAAKAATGSASADERPTVLAVPEHDEFCGPDRARATTAEWRNTRIVVITNRSMCSLSARQTWAAGVLKEWYLFPETLPASLDPAGYTSVEAYIDALTATARAQGRDRFFTHLASIAEEEREELDCLESDRSIKAPE